jgi:hypothetical protein
MERRSATASTGTACISWAVCPTPPTCSLIRISRCHVYLTVPFVVSWSLLEAMSMGATIVASDVAPVREVLEHGKTGLLVDFFDPAALARQVADVLANPAEAHAALGRNARSHVVDTYDFHTRALPTMWPGSTTSSHATSRLRWVELTRADKVRKMPGFALKQPRYGVWPNAKADARRAPKAQRKQAWCSGIFF